MKESAKLTPVESISTRRKALKPFPLSDGTDVETGQCICSAVRDMNLDPATYSGVNEFRSFRFVESEVLKRAFRETRRCQTRSRYRKLERLLNSSSCPIGSFGALEGPHASGGGMPRPPSKLCLVYSLLNGTWNWWTLLPLDISLGGILSTPTPVPRSS
ncbi:hypothetical protein F5Y14DRAFT_235713 [Nemania sp. NC0429]|nr:hypothetical protein F5Y14DRAFT_235713 [Nemania sp. NC0429]